MKLNRNHTISTLSVLSLSLMVGGCSSESTTSSGDDYASGAPELAAVQMRITGDATTEAEATPDDAIDPTTLASDELAIVSSDAGGGGTPDLNGAREAVRDLNQALRNSLQSIVALVRNTQPTYQLGDLRMWGPVVRGETEFRFFMRHPAPKFQWRLDGRVANTAAAYSRIAAGEIAVGARPRRGIGVAGFDIDSLAAVDPTVTAQGKILVGFAHGPRGTTLAFGLKNFSRRYNGRTGHRCAAARGSSGQRRQPRTTCLSRQCRRHGYQRRRIGVRARAPYRRCRGPQRHDCHERRCAPGASVGHQSMLGRGTRANLSARSQLPARRHRWRLLHPSQRSWRRQRLRRQPARRGIASHGSQSIDD